jgi:hypothetical protein
LGFGWAFAWSLGLFAGPKQARGYQEVGVVAVNIGTRVEEKASGHDEKN